MSAVPVERIDTAAAEVRLGGGVKRLVAACIYWPSYAAGAAVRGLGWTIAAVKVGYRDGRAGRG